MKTLILVISTLLLSGLYVKAENLADQVTNYKVQSYEMVISGTSTLHDWTADATSLNASLTFNPNGDFKNGFGKLEIQVPVDEIKSGKSGMDTRIYDALQSRRHQNIIYRLTEVVSAEQNGSGSYTLQTKGDLTIAGTTLPITMPVEAVKSTNGQMTFVGSYTTKMTEFNVTPPTAMMGTVRSGDEITITFKLQVQPH